MARLRPLRDGKTPTTRAAGEPEGLERRTPDELQFSFHQKKNKKCESCLAFRCTVSGLTFEREMVRAMT